MPRSVHADATAPPSLQSMVRARAREIGLSQAQIGDAIGASQNTVSRFMRGKASLATDLIVPLERLLRWPWGTIAAHIGLTPPDRTLPGDISAAIDASVLDNDQKIALHHLLRLITDNDVRGNR